MGTDNGAAKSSVGFFHLFDWNRKSCKKLFSTALLENSKQGKQTSENFLATPLHLTDEDDAAGVSTGKGSSDYSCASSVADEEGIMVKAPGVVARLMGLDSMPTSAASEPYTTALFDARSPQYTSNHKRSPEFYVNDQFKYGIHQGENFSMKQLDLKSQKIPSSPIERFQTESLPRRLHKSISVAHHKLLSPIKNPGFISRKNAAHIMEEAAKILEPGSQAGIRSKSSFSSSSIPPVFRDSNDSLPTSQKTPRIFESARTPIDSTDSRYLRGKTLSRSWNGLESTPVFRRPKESEGSNIPSEKGKGKSISLAVQAKVNVQRREGLGSSTGNMSDQRDHDECKVNQKFKSQPRNQNNKTPKKSVNVSGVLRQNNQKQNWPTGKGKLDPKQFISNHQGRKILSGNALCGNNKTVNKLPGNPRVGNGKDILETVDLDSEGPRSSNKDFPQKKRLIDRNLYSDKSASSGNILMGRREKHIQTNVVIDERLRRTEDKKVDLMDIVSFTFTSPLIKPIPGSQYSSQVVQSLDCRNIHSSDSNNGKNQLGTKDKKLLNLGLNSLNGDALSTLLKQKLRELIAGVELSDCNFIKPSSSTASTSVLQESTSAYSTLAAEGAKHERKLPPRCFKNSPGTVVGYSVSSTSNQLCGISHRPQDPDRRVVGMNAQIRTVRSDRIGSDHNCQIGPTHCASVRYMWEPQVVEEMECRSRYDSRKEPDHQQSSPFSILEPCFSNESCNSSESSASTHESNMCSSSVRHQNIISFNCGRKTSPIESAAELMDSASSSNTDVMNGVHGSETGLDSMESHNGDLYYVMELLEYTGMMSEDRGIYHTTNAAGLDPPIFDKLENKRRWSTMHGVDCKEDSSRRKMIFDCVNECLDLRCSRYIQAGFRAWSRGAAVIGKDLAKEIHKQILGWKTMGGWMVEELVDKDMSSHLGRWVDFEIEAFETGLYLENEMIDSLVDEVVADFSCILSSRYEIAV